MNKLLTQMHRVEACAEREGFSETAKAIRVLITEEERLLELIPIRIARQDLLLDKGRNASDLQTVNLFPRYCFKAYISGKLMFDAYGKTNRELNTPVTVVRQSGRQDLWDHLQHVL